MSTYWSSSYTYPYCTSTNITCNPYYTSTNITCNPYYTICNPYAITNITCNPCYSNIACNTITNNPYTSQYYSLRPCEPIPKQTKGTQTENEDFEVKEEKEVLPEVKEEKEVLPEVKEDVLPELEVEDDFEIVTIETVEEDSGEVVKREDAQEILFGKEAEEAFLKGRQ